MAEASQASDPSITPKLPKTPRSYWLVAGGLLLWAAIYSWLVANAFFIATPEYFESRVTAGTILPGYSDYVQHLPGWVVMLTMTNAVIRLAGAAALLLRNRFAVLLYSLSFVLVCIIFMRGFLFANLGRVIKPSQMLLEGVFFGLSVFAVWFAARALLRGQLD